MLFRSKGSPNPIIEYLKESDADIICLQEYAYSVPDKKKGITESEIKGRMSDYKYYRSDKVMKDGEMFLAVFSKYPILSATPIKYKDRYITSMVYDIDVDGKTLTVINNHLESNRLSPEDRAFYDSMIRHFNPEKLDMVKSTLIDKLSSAYLIRAEQADNIARVIDSKHTPVVVCGDFNDTPISYTYNTVRGSLKDAYQNSGLGPGITYHENKFLFRIDHILHSDNIKSYNATVDKVKHSDHYPVYVFLDIN